MKAIAELDPLQPDDTASRREEAYARLSDLLASGRLHMGDKVSLRAVADALGTSIMPVREAVSRLVADRALEVTPSRAVRVPVMTRGEFQELTRVRVTIEGHAAAEAASRREPADLRALQEAESLFRTQGLAPEPDVRRAVELNMAFHFALYAAARSPLLVKIIRGMWLKAGPVINLSVRENPHRLATGGVKLHAAILDAVASGDAAAARQGIAHDIESAAEYILSRSELADDDPGPPIRPG